MGSISLLSLTLHNFRSFKGRHEFRFPKSGLVILRGASGSGKTNVLLALAYLFRYCPHSAKALQCWYDDAPMWVEVELDTAEGVVVVRRGIKGLTIGKLKGTAAEEKLDGLMGVPPELREILTYRDQVEPKQFLKMRDGALKSFLVDVLQLHGLEDEIDAAAELLGKLSRELEVKQALLQAAHGEYLQREAELAPPALQPVEELEGALGEAADAVAIMEARIFDTGLQLDEAKRQEGAKAEEMMDGNLALVAELGVKVTGVKILPAPEQDHTALNALKDKLQQARAFLAQLEAVDKLQWRAYEDETAKVRQETRQLHNELGKVPGLKDNIERLTANAEQLKKDICGMCSRPWENARVEHALVLAQIEAHRTQLEAIRGHQVKLKELETWLEGRAFVHDARLEKLTTVMATLKEQVATEERRLEADAWKERTRREAEIKELQYQANVLRSEAQQLRWTYLNDPQLPSKALAASQDVLKASLSTEQKRVAEIKSQLALVRQANRSALAAHDEAVKRVGDVRRRFEEVNAAETTASAAWKTQADYVDMLNGFRNKIFGEVLESIGADASTIIGSLPNSSHISIDFSTEKETLKGKVQERITPVTYLHGKARPLKESVSGGQLTSISLAVDLAVAGVISQRLGCHLNWIILDESFEGHDVPTKLACLEMLQAYAANKLVLIVDHGSEAKEMFTKEINIVFENKLSSVKP
jgi:energy-coupling factor transporter ATP-binding protein EcfA2